jgi:adenylate cyclase
MASATEQVKIEQPTNYSAAVWQVWKMAAVIAERKQTLIEPVHFLSSIFSLIAHGDPAHLGDPDIKVELDEVAKIMERHGLGCDEILHRLQAPGDKDHTLFPQSQFSGRAPISRSAVTKKAFEYAFAAAASESISKARLRHLVGGILTYCKDLYTTLGIDPVQGMEIASELSRTKSANPGPSLTVAFPSPFPPPPPAPPPPFPAPDTPARPPQFHNHEDTGVVLHTVDANAVLGTGTEINWNVIGPKYKALCEMAWEAGACGSFSALLQSVIEKILGFIPRATHGAILIVDPLTNDMDLKAHAPRGNISLSRSSAQQALDSQQAFIWQRQKDMTKTQFEAHIESGVYAPIIADGKSYGVICLNSKSAASRLTEEDLFLAAALGHQVGLVLANRNLKVELAQKVSVLERLMTNFSPQVRKHLIERAQAGKLKLGGERSYVTILCADIRGFTVMASKMDTDDLIALLNDYFASMVECVFRHGGTIDKFIGDALLVVFNSPEPMERHAEHAAKAALSLQEGTRGVSERRRARGETCCGIGIGVHTGEVIHGFIGSADRMEYTIIGDAVNLTSRYCSAAGPGDIIISPQVYEKLWRNIQVETTEVATKHEGNLAAYKLMGFNAG